MSQAPVGGPVANRACHPPLWAGFLIFLVASFLFASNHRNAIGGDNRALAEMGWWFAHSRTLVLDDHPAYRDESVREFGYWARRTEEGRVVSVYPTGILLFTIPLHLVVDALGIGHEYGEMGRASGLVMAVVVGLAIWACWASLWRATGVRTALVTCVLLAAGTAYWGVLSQAPWSQAGGVVAQALSVAFLVAALHRAPTPDRGGRWMVGLLSLAGFFAVWAPFGRPTFAAWTILFFLWAGWELRGRAWPALVGGLVAVALGLWWNIHTTGAWSGSYVDKAGEVGFALSPGDNLRALMAICFSPGRGLFLFSPWVLLAWVGLLVAGREMLRRRSADVGTIVHGIFFLTILGAVAGFGMWHGGWSAGPRLQIDLLFSAAMLAAIAIRRLAQVWWGCVLVVALAVPSVLINARIARMPDSVPDEFLPRGEQMMDWTWDWGRSAYRWYWTSGANLPEVMGRDLSPRLEGYQILPSEESSEGFLGAGVVRERRPNGAWVFRTVGPRSEFLFEPASVTGDLFVGFALDLSQAGHLHDLQVEFNGTRLARFHWQQDYDPDMVLVRVPAGLMAGAQPNRLVIVDRRPAQTNLGQRYLRFREVFVVPVGQLDRDRLHPRMFVGGEG